MSDNNKRTSDDDIKDWLAGSGGTVMGALTVLLVIFFIATRFTG